MKPTQPQLYCEECPLFRYKDKDGDGQCAVTRKNHYFVFRCCFTSGWYPEEMTNEYALRVLHHYQKWLRGGKGEQPSHALVGLAIDTAIRALRSKVRADKKKVINQITAFDMDKEELQKLQDELTEQVKGFIAEAIEKRFGKAEEPRKPTLDDYTTIKTYEDACEALCDTGVYGDSRSLPNHIIALMKLETISRALWGRNWRPTPDAKGKETYWYPWFALWTKDEIKDLNATQRGALLSANAYNGVHAGFGFLKTYCRASIANAYFGFRLCQETEEKARYFGTQFVELWAEYLRFNFTTGERVR